MALHGVVVVCGGDPGLGQPTLWGDVTGTAALGVAEEDREDRFAVEGATHVTVVTRREWADRVRSAVTVLRAHDPGRHVTVLETEHTPLGATLAARSANERLAHDPALQHRELAAMLRAGNSGLWVRSAGRLPGRVPLAMVISSWWRKAGNLDSQLAGLTQARSENWFRAAGGGTDLVAAGHVPEAVAEQLALARIQVETVADRPSPGGRALAGQDQAFEFAWADPRAGHGVRHDERTHTCDSCGALVEGTCPFCHASWGVATIAQEGQL